MYASKITINYKPQKIRTHRDVELPNRLLTLNDISKHIKDGETFYFFQKAEVDYIKIYSERFETDDELKMRVAKEEEYNENYEKHHAKYGR